MVLGGWLGFRVEGLVLGYAQGASYSEILLELQFGNEHKREP